MATMGHADRLSEAIWDIAKAAKELSRFDFILEFVRRQTAKKKDRKMVEGYQLRKANGGWTYRSGTGVDMTKPIKDPAKVYDVIRRTPLHFYVRQAEALRAEALQ